jgi:flagellar basal body rod protein FlgG
LVSNNLANSATVGYKPEKSFFSIYNKAKADGRDLPLSGYVNDGTMLAQSGMDFSQGALRSTGRGLDLGVEGNGFFMVRTPQGVQATRDGRFELGKNGEMEAMDGAPLLGINNLPITVNPQGGKVEVLQDGSVQQDGNVLGQIGLKAFAQPSALQRVGANRYDATGVPNTPVTGTVSQGALEQSSVDLPSCMIDMIRLNRLFEMSMKVASTVTNDMDAKSISDISTGR